MKIKDKIMDYFFIIIIVIFFGWATYNFIYNIYFYFNSERVNATVINCTYSSTVGTNTLDTFTGIKYKVRGKIYKTNFSGCDYINNLGPGNKKVLIKNQTVLIKYDKNNPEIIDKKIYFWPYFYIVSFMLISIIGYIYKLKNNKKLKITI